MPADLYKTMVLRLQYLTTELSKSSSRGPVAAIEFLKTDVFKIKRHGRLWKREEVQFINELEKQPDSFSSDLDEKAELISTTGGTGKSNGGETFKFMVASPESRKNWNLLSKWVEYIDEKEGWEKFKQKISSSPSQSDMFTFRTKFFNEPIEEVSCAWCGAKFSNNGHIFWECEHARVFWEEYLQHVNKSLFADKKYLEKAVMSQLNLGTCFKEDRQKFFLDHDRKQLALLAKSYLLVCQRKGVVPLHHEHWSQINASRRFRSREGNSIGGYKHTWGKCPLPPLIGRD